MVKKTTLNCCPGNGCHAGCLLRTHVEDGKIVKVERLTYPDGEKGDICLKGVAGARLPYHPDRLKYVRRQHLRHNLLKDTLSS